MVSYGYETLNLHILHRLWAYHPNKIVSHVHSHAFLNINSDEIPLTYIFDIEMLLTYLLFLLAGMPRSTYFMGVLVSQKAMVGRFPRGASLMGDDMFLDP